MSAEPRAPQPCSLTCDQLLSLVRSHLLSCRCLASVLPVQTAAAGSPSSRTLPLCGSSCYLGSASADDAASAFGHNCAISPSTSTGSQSFLAGVDPAQLDIYPMSPSASSAEAEAAAAEVEDAVSDEADSAALAVLRLLSLSDFADDDNCGGGSSSSNGRASSTPVRLAPRRRVAWTPGDLLLASSMAEPPCSVDGQDSLMESVPNRPLP